MSKILSVVIPVYNAEKYLRNCFDSLFDQGLSQEEIEIICVNDGSKDNSISILNEYAAKYNNIIVVDKENTGVSDTRNKGLDLATGKYVAFCDSDDYLCTGVYRSFIDTMEMNDVDVLIMREFKTVSDAETYKYDENVEIKIDILDNSDLAGRNAWAIMLKRDLIEKHNIRFYKGMRYAEDTLFAAMVFAAGMIDNAKLAVTYSPLYCYRFNPNSAMRSVNSKKHMEDMFTMGREYKRVLSQKFDNELLEIRMSRRICEVVPTILFDNVRCQEYSPKELYKKLKEEGLYPYKTPFWIIKGKSLKIVLMNLWKCTFKCKLLYSLYFKLMSLIKE